MKKYIRIVLPVFLVLTFPLAFFAPVKAAEILSEEKNVSIDENVSDDLYLSGETISVNAEVDGDLFVSGGQITLNNYVSGNVYISGGTIRINGNISGNLFCAGGQIDIDGNISRSAYIGGGTLTIDGNIGEDLNVGAGVITLNGNVTDDVRIGAGTATVNSQTIGGDLMLGTGTPAISDETEVGGDTILDLGDSQADKVNIKPDFTGLRGKSALSIILSLTRRTAVMLGWILVGWLLFKFAPVKSRRITDLLAAGSSSLKSFLVGCGSFLSLIIIIPIAILLAILGIGQPLVQLLSSLFVIAITIASIYVSTAIIKTLIRFFTKKKYDKYVEPMILGVIIFQLIGWIPCCLGLTVKIILTVWGFGAIIITKWEAVSKAKK
ncbi:MAG: hypothetical protein PHS44_01240 [Candidatus Dojkabacteria bacterium]|jgi:cytoskeletal protein CcmA (bactofilin family)|nr:hypothetical protein [Candidatus Dojkabacteria bacterium]